MNAAQQTERKKNKKRTKTQRLVRQKKIIAECRNDKAKYRKVLFDAICVALQRTAVIKDLLQIVTGYAFIYPSQFQPREPIVMKFEGPVVSHKFE